MLNELPQDVWTNPNLKWLDPAVGIGNFPVIAYLKLMDGLKSYNDGKLDLTNEEERRKHILEKMLYMVEVSEKSIFILNKVFCGIYGGGQYKLNIFHGSFVENKDTKEGIYNLFKSFEDGTSLFDIVMGNPPYQFSHGSGNPVYQHFALRGMDLLNENGKLCLIIPVGWKKYFSGDKRETAITYNTLKKYEIYSLNMNIEIEHFPPVDYFVIIKNINIIKTNVNCYFDNKIYKTNIIISNLPFIPLLLNNTSIKIVNILLNAEGSKLDFKYPISKLPGPTDRSKVKIGDLIYPHIHLLDNKGIGELLYFKNKKEIFNNKKVIINVLNTIENPPLYPFIDKNGEYGTTQRNVIMIGDDNIVTNVNYLLESKLIKFILKITQYSSGMYKQNEYKILNLITYPDKPLKTDQQIYEYYKINKTEQKLIEEIVSNSEKSKPKKKEEGEIEFIQPEEKEEKYINKYKKCLEEGKLWNIKTKKCLKDTKDNRRKLTSKKPPLSESKSESKSESESKSKSKSDSSVKKLTKKKTLSTKNIIIKGNVIIVEGDEYIITKVVNNKSGNYKGVMARKKNEPGDTWISRDKIKI